MTDSSLSLAGKPAVSPQPVAGLAGSVGVVKPQFIAFEEPLQLAGGYTLPRYELAVETYGELNADRSNAVLI